MEMRAVRDWPFASAGSEAGVRGVYPRNRGTRTIVAMGL
jgi:hypothetical protein